MIVNNINNMYITYVCFLTLIGVSKFTYNIEFHVYSKAYIRRTDPSSKCLWSTSLFSELCLALEIPSLPHWGRCGFGSSLSLFWGLADYCSSTPIVHPLLYFLQGLWRSSYIRSPETPYMCVENLFILLLTWNYGLPWWLRQ